MLHGFDQTSLSQSLSTLSRNQRPQNKARASHGGTRQYPNCAREQKCSSNARTRFCSRLVGNQARRSTQFLHVPTHLHAVNNFHACEMQICDKLVSGRWIMPCYLDYNDLLCELLKRWNTVPEGERPKRAPGVQLVRKVIHKDFPHVAPPLGGDWGQCNQCVILRQRRRAGVASYVDQLTLERDCLSHHAAHAKERAAFAERRQLAREKPEQYSQIQIDLTRAAQLPSYTTAPSALATLMKLRLSTGGIISESTSTRVLFFYSDAIAKGGNTIASALYAQVRAIKTCSSIAANAHTLFLQCDGGSENINRCVCVEFRSESYHR